MDTQAVAEAFMMALDEGDFETAASYLADDFEFSNHTMPPIGKNEWLGMSMALKGGFPDLSYNFQIHEVDGNHMQGSAALTGTHSGDLDMSGMGMGVIPATGKYVETAREYNDGVVEDGLIHSIHVHDSPETGLAALLAAIGVQPPM
jgi:hypothetical protein